LTATILSLPICDYFFIEPRYTWFIYDARGDSISLGVFLLVGAGVSVLAGRFRQIRIRLRQAVLDLEHSEARFRTLAATVPEMLFTTTAEGGAGYISDRFHEYTGMDAEQWRVDWQPAVHPDQRKVIQDWAKAMGSGAEFSSAYRIRRMDGEYRWFQAHARPVRGMDGRIIQWTGVCADIHGQKTLEEALRRRTEELAESNAQFQKFAYRVSHDLNEPLRTVRVFTELLAKRNESSLDSESRTLIGYILGSAERSQHQIRQLLEYARAGSLELKRELVNFGAILETATANLQSTIAETGATVTRGQLPSLVANPEAVLSIFQNLIGNALKYRSNYAPRIHISARLKGEEWIFGIEDNGRGFDMGDVGRIFGAFERLSPADGVQGSGLGLAIVKRIVELTGGRIWAESEPGKGSTFFFSLPRSLERKGTGQKEGPIQSASAQSA
jgi:PAS domain S-box-containing protein